MWRLPRRQLWRRGTACGWRGTLSLPREERELAAEWKRAMVQAHSSRSNAEIKVGRDGGERRGVEGEYGDTEIKVCV